MNKIEAILFDMDGVLCDSEEYIAEAAVEMFRKTYNVEVKAEDFLPFVGTGEDRYLGGVAEKYDLAFDLDRDKKCTYDIYLEIIKGKLQPLAGVREFIALARDKGLKLAVATSADLVKMVGNLREISLPDDTFDVCINGLDVNHKKPDPEIFLTAAEKLNVKPENAIVVEDAKNGIQAAKAAGCMCLGLATSFTQQELKDEGADWTADNLADVPAELLELLKA